MRALRPYALFGVLTLLGGCFVVTPEHRDDVLNGGGNDAGVDGAVPDTDGEVGTDAGFDAGGGGENLLQDGCGGDPDDYEVLVDSRPPFIVDTRELVNRISTCGTGGSPGHDGFLAIEVTAGDLWHFHVIPDPATPGQEDRDPFLYLVQGTGGSCDTRGCQHSSNACTGTGDEHFAFVAPADGIWYLGIDDASAGGGVYQIEAIRLQCGDGTDVHGEACDGTANCNSACQEVLSTTRPNEIEANDNEIEANFVEIPAANEITLSGNIGGGTCIYPDVFQFRVEDEGSALDVDILKTDGTLCDSAALTPFDIVLRNTAGEIRQDTMTDPVTGCSQLRVTGLSAAAYFLYLEHDAPIEDRIVNYQVRIRVTPP